MKKKNIHLKKKLMLKKETLALLMPDQQAAIAGGFGAAFASRFVMCDTNSIVVCLQ
jgi:hypothetical protein